MDEFIDQFFSSSSAWSDENVSERSSWVGNGTNQTNGILTDTMGAYEMNEKNSSASLIPSTHVIDSLISQGTSMLVDGDSSYGLDQGLLPGESQPLLDGSDCGSKLSLLGIMDGNLKPGYTMNTSPAGTLNYGPPDVLPVAGGLAKSPSVQPESGSVGSNDCETPEIQPSHRDSHSLSSVPRSWPPSSYRGVSPLSPVMGQDKLQGLCLPGQFVKTDAAVFGNEYFRDDNILQGNLSASLSANGQDELNNPHISSFVAGHHIPLGRTSEIHSQMQIQLSQLSEENSIKHYTEQSSFSQLPHASATACGGCNGSAKPRVRARRGQATDPHSIAERLRREKIAERMRNLQELVPNSNKTDKASMLDEIIEYVKFLQLQVKVLSMSRLGAAEAVVPHITDSGTEGSTGLLLSESAGHGFDPFESPDDLAFEQDVVKLMESSVTSAMQFLQTKGLCLMPIALAAAISGRKASSGSIFAGRNKPILTNGCVHHNNGPPGIGTGQISSDAAIELEENITGTHSSEDVPTNGCFEAIIKQEEAENSANITREKNPNA